jgi:phosphoribosylglycinamide formyltransferase-1
LPWSDRSGNPIASFERRNDLAIAAPAPVAENRGQTPNLAAAPDIGVRPRTTTRTTTRTAMTRRIGVLISGRGSNLQALCDAIADRRLRAEIAIVISNRAGAQGLDRARAAGIETLTMPHSDHPSREAFDAALARELRARGVGLVCLAGFMRLLGPAFLDAFPGAILNIHPSLLPAFPGVDAQRQAWEHGAKVAGATVHLVTGELDGGPIVRQEAIPVLDEDTPETLATRILAVEHRIYPDAVSIVLDGGWSIEGRRFVRRRSQ